MRLHKAVLENQKLSYEKRIAELTSAHKLRVDHLHMELKLAKAEASNIANAHKIEHDRFEEAQRAAQADINTQQKRADTLEESVRELQVKKDATAKVEKSC